MAEHFELPVSYKGKDYIFSAELAATGYSYKIYVMVDDMQVSFEPDEERNFRAVSGNEDFARMGKVDKGLLEEIANTLISIFKD